MVAMVMLAAVAEDHTHVRATEPRTLALIASGQSRSPTFRQLVDTLNASDVILYVEPKRTRQALGGYLLHDIMTAGAFRYVHAAIDTTGADGRLIPLLAHELQHAIEVAQVPEVRDARSLEEMFGRSALQFGCGGTTCYETQAATNIEYAVGEELRLTTHTRQGDEESPLQHRRPIQDDCCGRRLRRRSDHLHEESLAVCRDGQLRGEHVGQAD